MVYKDIYFTKEYGMLYEESENGKLEVFEYCSDIGFISNMFIKREIPTVIGREKYYDVITPYGYGGPIIVNLSDESRKDELVKGYHDEFKDYCLKNNIVAEFIRFHPINNNAKDFTQVYDVEYVRKTVGTNIKDYDDPIQSEFSKGCRKEIRRAFNKEVIYRIEKSPDNLDTFKEIYYKTMDRNKAHDYYYFDNKYFDSILRDLRDELLVAELIFEDKIIASEMYFILDKIIHAHLLGSLDEYLHLSAGCVLGYVAALWGKDNGYDYIHHGGGRTNSEDDPLYRYKKKFGKNTDFDFYIGKKIWDKDKYYELCKINNINIYTDFFPAYRSQDVGIC